MTEFKYGEQHAAVAISEIPVVAIGNIAEFLQLGDRAALAGSCRLFRTVRGLVPNERPDIVHIVVCLDCTMRHRVLAEIKKAIIRLFAMARLSHPDKTIEISIVECRNPSDGYDINLDEVAGNIVYAGITFNPMTNFLIIRGHVSDGSELLDILSDIQSNGDKGFNSMAYAFVAIYDTFKSAFGLSALQHNRSVSMVLFIHDAVGSAMGGDESAEYTRYHKGGIRTADWVSPLHMMIGRNVKVIHFAIIDPHQNQAPLWHFGNMVDAIGGKSFRIGPGGIFDEIPDITMTILEKALICSAMTFHAYSCVVGMSDQVDSAAVAAEVSDIKTQNANLAKSPRLCQHVPNRGSENFRYAASGCTLNGLMNMGYMIHPATSILSSRRIRGIAPEMIVYVEPVSTWATTTDGAHRLPELPPPRLLGPMRAIFTEYLDQPEPEPLDLDDMDDMEDMGIALTGEPFALLTPDLQRPTKVFDGTSLEGKIPDDVLQNIFGPNPDSTISNAVLRLYSLIRPHPAAAHYDEAELLALTVESLPDAVNAVLALHPGQRGIYAAGTFSAHCSNLAFLGFVSDTLRMRRRPSVFGDIHVASKRARMD